MNIENLREKYSELIAYMESAGYHKNYVYHVKREIIRILTKADEEGWKSYSDIYREYAGRLSSTKTLRNKRTFLGLICFRKIRYLIASSEKVHKFGFGKGVRYICPPLFPRQYWFFNLCFLSLT
jgi:hypothetical protein